MTVLLLLQLYLFVGLLYGASVVAVTEIVRPPHMMVLPVRLRPRIHITVLALGTLIWPLALFRNRSARS